ncbi:hypothetical protein SDRG_01600 [Saprolegnia diclina VS20]|uniref:Uncharacterized protein n=1 Tax=Saprolegnia diclina (strain VS20) TaxID=1156394 RepID=T0SFC1_SAPDV|nr:hypothetical protein SDRG_01600 [Saprolegnia diclina VS20]EQC41642.1 hypothetical protein SDRG_01600 [Saprolegnia diclina VS20]|eukprot:XP_008605356.1 hypothetical protein SDRG_01600 [Saprolegnia diclina VS20]
MMLVRRAARFSTTATPRVTIMSPDYIKETPLLLSTRDQIEGREVIQELGMVCGNVVRTKNILEDILAAFGGVLGGETRSYSSLMNETNNEAVHRMKAAALAQGATAVVRTKFETNLAMNRFVFGLHCSSVCYGTAVICRPKKSTQKEHNDDDE